MSPGETSSDEDPREGDSRTERHWSETLPYRGGSVVAPDYDAESDFFDRWHYGIYLAAVLLIAGVAWRSLALLVAGYVLVPVFVHLDSRYVESVTPGWQRDTGLYVLGAILAPFLLIPGYLYRRRELRR